jgi:hypothetical protein
MTSSNRPDDDAPQPIIVNVEVHNENSPEFNLIPIPIEDPRPPQSRWEKIGKSFISGLVWCIQNPDIFLKWMLVALVLKLLLTEGFSWKTLQAILKLQ